MRNKVNELTLKFIRKANTIALQIGRLKKKMLQKENLISMMFTGDNLENINTDYRLFFEHVDLFNIYMSSLEGEYEFIKDWDDDRKLSSYWGRVRKIDKLMQMIYLTVEIIMQRADTVCGLMHLKADVPLNMCKNSYDLVVLEKKLGSVRDAEHV